MGTDRNLPAPEGMKGNPHFTSRETEAQKRADTARSSR